MRSRAMIALTALAISATACRAPLGTGGPDRIEHPPGPADLVLRVEYIGGFVTPPQLTRFPTVSMYGDGRIVTEGPQMEIYPGPALPSLLVRTISEDGIQAILRLAQRDGLFRNAEHPDGCVADAPTTRVTVRANGTAFIVTAQALGAAGCPGSDAAATAALARFVSRIGDLSWLPGAVSPETAYEATAARIYVAPYQRRDDPTLDEPALEWPPLEGPGGALASFGQPVDAVAGSRCGVVAGDAWAAVRSAAAQANQLTPWASGGRRFSLSFRPLLPDERGC